MVLWIINLWHECNEGQIYLKHIPNSFTKLPIWTELTAKRTFC